MGVFLPTIRTIFPEVIYPIFGDRFGEEELQPVTLVSGEATASTETLTEGQTLNYNLRSIVGTQISGLQDWSQLTLDSVDAVIRYRQVSEDITDFENSDLRYSQDRWYGEAANDSDIDVASVPDTERPVYYNTTNNRFRLYSQNNPRAWVTPIPNHYDILAQPVTWLGPLSDAELTAYFESNTYNASRNYFFYQESRAR